MHTYVLAGPSGSGKSTFVKSVLDPELELTTLPDLRELVLSEANVVLSADDITFESGKFDPTLLSTAQAACLSMFIEALVKLQDTNTVLVVDNTNTSPFEISPYIQAHAALGGGDIDVVAFCTDWRVCVERTQHGTPPMVIRRQARRLERLLDEWPSFFPVPTLVREAT